jgi:hypothetical protein
MTLQDDGIMIATCKSAVAEVDFDAEAGFTWLRLAMA